jgi:large subunit ribosomal protein L35
MPKQKTHKGLAKRVKVTAQGKIKHRRAGASHLMSVKNAKRRRAIRRPAVVRSNVLTKKMRDAIEVR